MTPQELKASILQLAIQGKLVEQRPEEGSGGELLERIFAAKNAKYAKGAKKNSRAETPRRRGEADAASSREEIPDSEKPFDIPESWVWVRIGELGASTDTDSFCDGPFGSNLKTSHHISYPEVRIIQLSNIGEDGWKDKNVKYTSFRHLETVIPRCEVHPGDFVIAKMMPAGRTIQVPELGTRITLGSDAMKFVPHPMLNKQFLLYAMRSQVFLGQVYAEAHGITRVRTTLNSVKSYVLPLPPLAEQKRIVAKIEELLPYIDRYEKAWSKLEDFNKRFPGDMQKSLLQMAIQGKLVDQRPEEGTGEELYHQIQSEKQRLIKSGKIKKEKPLPEISPDEIPFDIPESWKWYRIGELFSIINGFTPLKSNPEFWENGEIPWFTIEDVHRQGRFITSTAKFITKKAVSKGTERIVPADTVLLCCTASIGEYAYAKIPLTTNQQFNAFVTKPWYQRIVYPLYVFEFVKTLKARLISGAGKTTFNFLSVGKLSSMLIPLPPLAEQKRIVAKLEELLPLCERLK